MAQHVIRWLHLSDFHVGKDQYAQRRLFSAILDHVRERVAASVGPDLVLITGDLANSGQTAEYNEFTYEFIYKLAELLNDEKFDSIYTVPGNHDVDRSKAKIASRYGILAEVPEILDPTPQGQDERKSLLPRFAAFNSADLTPRSGWLDSPRGFYASQVQLGGLRVGILGVNTAWFCRGDQDRHQLSPGIAIVEAGLEQIQDCDVRFVLGHHPIDWFLDDDVEPIRSILGKYRALYLHGHLHKQQLRQEIAAGYPFVAIQTGASFQAREDEVWVNSLLWCQLDFDQKTIEVEPRRWSRTHREWSLDGAALPERYRQPDTTRWLIPLPADAEPSAKPELKLPPGWIQIDRAALSEYHNTLDADQILSYINGRIPDWSIAGCSQIPQRAIVGKLSAAIEQTQQRRELGVMLLVGAGGEGKSTALRQIIWNLAHLHPDWNMLWHDDPSTGLSMEDVRLLTRTKGHWLIVSDDADLIAADLVKVVDTLRREGRKNFQFVLCCRDTDWNAAGDHQQFWNDYPFFAKEMLPGLTLDDATLIVDAWAAQGEAGLGELAKLPPVQRVPRFLEESRSELYRRDGAFLGAMLRVRHGGKLDEHVRLLLGRLAYRPIPGSTSGATLKDAFTYIAAMHAENLLFLSKIVLARVLHCNPGDIVPQIVRRLGQEAAIDTASHYVLTRHRAIAEVAVTLLGDETDLDEVYSKLAISANQLYLEGVYVPQHGRWGYLSTHFFEQGKTALGIRLAQEVFDLKPDDPYFFVTLSRLYREAEQPERSVELFRNASQEITRNRRPYFYEWGTAEGSDGRYALNAWLTAVSLADATERSPIMRKQAIFGLNGISIAFYELFERYNDPIFIQACSATTQLALTLDPGQDLLNSRSHTGLQDRLAKSKAAGVSEMNVTAALDSFKAGVIAAWQAREEELPDWVDAGDTLTYYGLARLFEGRSSASGATL